MKKTILIFFLIIALFENEAVSQNKKSSNLDQQFVPPAALTAGSTEEIDKDASEFKNQIKFNPILATRGKFALFYERKLFDGLIGLGAGYGLCLYKDLFHTYNAEDLTISDVNDINQSIGYSTILNYGIVDNKMNNRFFSIYGRVYIDYSSSDYIPYFEIGFRNSLTNLRFQNDPYDYDVQFKNPNQTTSITNNVLYVGYGYSMSTYGKKANTNHDFYLNVGIRNSYYEVFAREYDPNAYQSPANLYSLGKESKSTSLAFMIGYIFSVGM
jgi:hypothetical protein